MIDNTNPLKKEKRDVYFKYLPNQRYIIEIQNIESGRKYYTKRIGALPKAVGMVSEYNSLSGVRACVFDTKTGGVI